MASVGFQGFRLSWADAVGLAGTRARDGETIFVLDEKYRCPKSLSEALAMAAEYLKAERPDLPPPKHDPDWDTPCFRMFYSEDVAAQERGVIPGVLFVAVDAHDLHVLTEHELVAVQRTLFLPPKSTP